MRTLDEAVLQAMPADIDADIAANPATEIARKAIMNTIRSSCSVPLSAALDKQAQHSAEFIASACCREGTIGAEYARTMVV